MKHYVECSRIQSAVFEVEAENSGDALLKMVESIINEEIIYNSFPENKITIKIIDKPSDNKEITSIN
jgi:hypothetical protein